MDPSWDMLPSYDCELLLSGSISINTQQCPDDWDGLQESSSIHGPLFVSVFVDMPSFSRCFQSSLDGIISIHIPILSSLHPHYIIIIIIIIIISSFYSIIRIAPGDSSTRYETFDVFWRVILHWCWRLFATAMSTGKYFYDPKRQMAWLVWLLP